MASIRKLFSSYYSLEPDDYKTLWKKGILIVDSNILLDLHRRSKGYRESLRQALTQFKDRVFIPYHVLIEYHALRDFVCTEVTTDLKAIQDKFSDALGSISKSLNHYKNREHRFESSINTLLDGIKSARKPFDKQIEELVAEDLSTSQGVNEILNFIESLNPELGEAWDEKKLTSSISEGEERLKRGAPPGCEDANKKEWTIHKTLAYPQKFGDYFIWRQILDRYVNTQEPIVFLTGDDKKDWWRVEKDTVFGPRPELRDEINPRGDRLFWMYNPETFFRQSNSNGQPVNEKVIQEAREAPRDSLVGFRFYNFPRKGRQSYLDGSYNDLHFLARSLRDSLFDFFQTEGRVRWQKLVIALQFLDFFRESYSKRRRRPQWLSNFVRSLELLREQLGTLHPESEETAISDAIGSTLSLVQDLDQSILPKIIRRCDGLHREIFVNGQLASIYSVG